VPPWCFPLRGIDGDLKPHREGRRRWSMHARLAVFHTAS
jgi:hypothetical protein